MRTNGYRVIDFKGEELANGHVNGIYAKVHKSKKPLVFSNFLVGDSDEIQSPFFAGYGLFRTVDADTNGYDFVLTSSEDGPLIFTITSNDDIVIGA